MGDNTINKLYDITTTKGIINHNILHMHNHTILQELHDITQYIITLHNIPWIIMQCTLSSTPYACDTNHWTHDLFGRDMQDTLLTITLFMSFII